jgi:hypothetical protein
MTALLLVISNVASDTELHKVRRSGLACARFESGSSGLLGSGSLAWNDFHKIVFASVPRVGFLALHNCSSDQHPS